MVLDGARIVTEFVIDKFHLNDLKNSHEIIVEKYK